MKLRKLKRIVQAQASSDGAGVRIQRLAGRDLNRAMDPFLMIDEIRSEDGADYIGGFPSHPHRGFETITYMKQGLMRHKDHMGNEGLLAAGDVQWMTAARGVIHSEMPEQSEGLLHGFQLWLNLPAAEKMLPAAYADYASEQLPVFELGDGSAIKVIAGTYSPFSGDQRSAGPEVNAKSVTSPIPQGTTEALYWDLQLAPGAQWQAAIPAGHNLAVYVYEGSTVEVEGMALATRQLGLYGDGEGLQLQAGSQGLSALVVAGKPLKEPIAQHGPFVMNSTEEIEQAIADYQAGRLV
ncbi:pirin family protein [Dasania marina]|uniref:pirin family protein n=1 Tax=Dasania marina TaxID=471499 RepID=UPI0030DC2D96|tara:strand:+ start:5059 stop:5943 length:885 start_codon:yes stop_codon:yes gene_type:complete